MIVQAGGETLIAFFRGALGALSPLLRPSPKRAIIPTWILPREVEEMNLKRAVWSVLKFEFVWKLLTLVIISPLFD